MRGVTDFIDTRLSSTIRIAELADLAQLSEGHFHRAFRATTGRRRGKFIHGRHVAMATLLLARSDPSIAQTALRVGQVDLVGCLGI
ncbi:hypothetical protein CQ13_12745 [Bradyrhizobium retamae]|uniref:HTH araC/xylS-type domain-containing protein n=1 Tax=Bradyrhizobium retamae TaxID=1300035 RepID=A0A0R3MB62_9BRAD|nr:hypothetical protein CQ13_12745 [Bradyrhizobium retamae]